MRRLWIVLLVVSWAGLAVAQTFTVGRIEVVGNANVPTREILAAVKFKVGEEVTRDQVLAAVQEVLELGYFAQATPELAFDGDLVVVRFKVVEYPKIERITLEGLPPAPKGKGTLWSWFQEALAGGHGPGEAKIREILAEHGVKTGAVLNQKKLEEGLMAVIEEYRERDWATVQFGRIVPGAELVIEIQELVVVGHRFRGISTVPEEEARKLVSVVVGEAGKMSEIQSTMARFGRSVYFASANVLPELGEGGLWFVWDLVERVLLPSPTPLRGVDLLGVTAFPVERIQGRIGPLPAGSVTNLDVLRALGPVYDYYRREGFFMVEFVGEGVEGGLLRVRVKEGRIARIEVGEDTRTVGWVIERVMGLSAGQYLTESRYAAARQALMALGYFSDVVLEPRWAADELVLKVSVTDVEKLGSIGGSMAFSPQDQGIVGNLSYSQKNLFGKAMDVSLSFAKGLTQAGSTTWGLSYRSHSFPVFDLAGLDFYRRESGTDPVTVTVGGSAIVAYPLAHYLDLSLTLTTEQAWEGPDREPLDPKTSVEAGFAYDDRDSPFFPRTGNRGRVSLEKAGTFAPGVEYFALKADLARFSPLDVAAPFGETRAVLAWRAVVRWGWDLPERYRFDLGGVDSVRGAKAVRTDRFAFLNSEFRIELAQGSWVALFWDLGADLGVEKRVKSSVGIELAANIAGMFVRLDLAWPNDREPTWVPTFEFGMSPMF
ncbi:MAG: POTRA domain-containing protein [Candidatus Bipolaricaulota bacterium]